MWKATRISADAAEKMQINAGIVLNKFSVNSPTEPKDEDIVCETTGDFSISCTPTVEDLFADVNNAPTDTMEGKHITGWSCTLGFTALSVTEQTLTLALGAADSNAAGASGKAITPRGDYEPEDFKTLYWIGDMIDEDTLLCVKISNALSTGGLSITTTNKGKGKLGVTLTGHTSLSDQFTVPMEFYILKKVASQAQSED